MKYSFITQHKNTFSVRLMCQLLDASRNGYYHCYKTENRSDPECEELLDLVQQIAGSSGYTYGSRRMVHELKALSRPGSRQNARRLKRETGVCVRYRKKCETRTNSNTKQPLFPILVRPQFDVE